MQSPAVLPVQHYRSTGMTTRVILVLAFTFAAIGALVSSSLSFAWRTEEVAQELSGRVFGRVTLSTSLELLLERHRRLVESAPAEALPSLIEALLFVSDGPVEVRSLARALGVTVWALEKVVV